MRILALCTFTAFAAGQMNVFNAGEEGDLPDHMAQGYIDADMAEAAPEPEVVEAKPKGKKAAAADTPVAALDAEVPPA